MSKTAINYGMGTLDYAMVIAIVVLSTAVGLFHALRSKNTKSTRDFLVANKNVGIVPLILSAVATLMSSSNVLGMPAEVYSNGFQVVLIVLEKFVANLFTIYAILPVYFHLKVSTVNQYVEYRFNRVLRIFPAVIFLLQSIVLMASLSHLTCMVCSDALGLSYWATMAAICGTCIAYTSLGGFIAVIWTDVLQAVVMIVAVGFLVIKGTWDEGGVSQVWNRNYEGNRTIIFRSSFENDTNYSVWSIMIGGFVMSIGYSTIGQPLMQRQLANKKLSGAKITTLISSIIIATFIAMLCWIGLIVFAHFHNCDPLLNRQISSRDQLVALFAKDVFNDIPGLKGLFIAGILAATLSTLSSSINAISTVMVHDFVKPLLPNLKDYWEIIVSKVFGVLYGAAIVATTLLIKNFGSIRQLLYMTIGTTSGPTAGLFFLGFFFPWATAKGAMCGYVCAVGLGFWAAIGRFTTNVHRHYSLPVTTDGCVANTIHFLNQSFVRNDDHSSTSINQTASFGTSHLLSSINNQSTPTLMAAHVPTSQDVFVLYRITPMWYYAIAVLITLVVGLLVSILTGIQDPETLDPHLISPLTWLTLRQLPVKCRKWLGFKSDRFHGDMKLATIYTGIITKGTEKEMTILNPRMEITDKDSATILEKQALSKT